MTAANPTSNNGNPPPGSYRRPGGPNGSPRNPGGNGQNRGSDRRGGNSRPAYGPRATPAPRAIGGSAQSHRGEFHNYYGPPPPDAAAPERPGPGNSGDPAPRPHYVPEGNYNSGGSGSSRPRPGQGPGSSGPHNYGGYRPRHRYPGNNPPGGYQRPPFPPDPEPPVKRTTPPDSINLCPWCRGQVPAGQLEKHRQTCQPPHPAGGPRSSAAGRR